MPLRGHDPELPASPLATSGSTADHSAERLERLVERVVVKAIRLEQLVDPVRVQRLHLRHQPLPADCRRELLVRDLAPEHRSRRVLHRREDDRPRVDQRAVEVEEDDGKAHGAIVATLAPVVDPFEVADPRAEQ